MATACIEKILGTSSAPSSTIAYEAHKSATTRVMAYSSQQRAETCCFTAASSGAPTLEAPPPARDPPCMPFTPPYPDCSPHGSHIVSVPITSSLGTPSCCLRMPRAPKTLREVFHMDATRPRGESDLSASLCLFPATRVECGLGATATLVMLPAAVAVQT